MSRKVNLGDGRNHPHVMRSLEMAKKCFENLVLQDQDILRLPSGWNKVLELCQSSEVTEKLNKRWALENEKHGIIEKKKSNNGLTKKELEIDSDEENEESISLVRWDELVTALEKDFKKRKESRFITSQQLINEIILQYVYPRLDENVSTHVNHLLKSPFCIHPKTGKVCVPIPEYEFDKFDPLTVPTIVKLLIEIDKYDANRRLKKTVSEEKSIGEKEIEINEDQGKEGKEAQDTSGDISIAATEKAIPDIEKTSLNKYIKFFKIFVDRLPTVDNSFKDKLSF
ncbi:DNA primase small subunit [Smittium culicis]|uniref:DNA primase small subunit n=1 Tax=Smittium culicis TaxID=133412 RepID=A0A1R1XBD3_9FUNG|nr:DNA primase small subunit [Smittium culicis]